MLQEVSNVTSDPSVLRRLTFAANALPKDTPRYWELVTRFGFQHSSVKFTWKSVKVCMENVKCLDEDAFNDDESLTKELIALEGFQNHSIGIVLISQNNICKACNGKLLVRKDRPSFPVVYTDNLDTINGTHFQKYCHNHMKGCSFTQHYGCCTLGSEAQIIYEKSCLDLPYFLSTSMTVFSTKMLSTISAEILLAQTSYQQKVEIYNHIHGYDFSILKTTYLSVENDSLRYDLKIHAVIVTNFIIFSFAGFV